MQPTHQQINFDGTNLEVISQIGSTRWHIKYAEVIQLENCYSGVLTYVTRNGIPDSDGIGERFMISGLK